MTFVSELFTILHMKILGKTKSGDTLLQFTPREMKKMTSNLGVQSEHLAAEVIAYREDNKLSLRDFAKQCGLSASMLCRIEGGADTRLSSVEKIRKAMQP